MPRHREQSLFEFFGEGEGHDCGYCGGEDTSLSSGAWGHLLHARDYQTMIDRGWRRSGKYVYKPNMKETCCPQFTIRCMAGVFKPSKHQKKALKKFRSYIMDGEKDEKEETSAMDEGVECSGLGQDLMDSAESKVTLDKSNYELATREEKTAKSSNVKKAGNNGEIDEKDGMKTFKAGDGADPNKPKSQKKKQMRIARALAKNPEKFRAKQKERNKEVTLEELTDLSTLCGPNLEKEPKHKFEMRLVKAKTEPDDEDPELDPDFVSTFAESFAVYKKYQMAIHNDPASKLTQRSFIRFLCNSALITNVPAGENSTGLKVKYGGYHQQYLIDGKIVAVGVIDILPACVSSVYLYYDPDYSFLSFGTVSALFELAFTRSLRDSLEGQIRWYYMGYYIHSCPKMRYKAKYRPSQLLCPDTLTWHNIEATLPKIEACKFARLARDDVPDDEGGDPDLAQLMFGREVLQFRDLKKIMHGRVSADTEADVKEFTRLMGPSVATKMTLFLNFK